MGSGEKEKSDPRAALRREEDEEADTRQDAALAGPRGERPPRR